MAAGHALRQHVDSFQKKPGIKTEFARFPAGLVQLARYGNQIDEEPPGIVDRTANGIGKAAVVGGLGLAGAALLRGRRLNPVHR